MSVIALRQHIESLQQQGVFAFLEVQFAFYLQKLMPTDTNEDVQQAVMLAALLSSHFNSQGHICIDLSQYAEHAFPDNNTENALILPPLADWLTRLRQAKTKQGENLIGQPSEYTPLILEANRLYLYRYWDYEQFLAENLRQRLATPLQDIDIQQIEQGLNRLFPSNTIEIDWQKIAAQTALTQRVCLISGGPGTGKTSTVVKILALLLEQNPNCQIALAAPTGKAAARLQESIRLAKPRLDIDDLIKDKIPETAYTLHRLLGTIRDSCYFRHHADNPLAFDVIVVDEASMVDLALMAKLAAAISANARWILLGDKDQLASVEAGSVLGDICQAATAAASPIHKSFVQLLKSYRFDGSSGIGRLAEAIKHSDAEHTLALLQNPPRDLSWQPISAAQLEAKLVEPIVAGFKRYLTAASPFEALEAFNDFRVLCALRKGTFGIENLNKLIEQILQKQQLIKLNQRWYHGRPIMITQNEYNLNLFNGDIGIVFVDSLTHEPRVFFPDSQHQVKAIYPNRLPEHETVYAMTVHKSQGSEFKDVLIVLPEQSSAILNRELIYTAITRAKQSVKLWAQQSILESAVQHKVERYSGLSEKLV